MLNSPTLVYARFDANDPHSKKHFPINSSESRFGPGTYPAGKYEEAQKTYGANKVKGTFLAGKREVVELKNPGPGAYKAEDPEGFGEHDFEQFKFARSQRPPTFKGKPDYDGGSFYKLGGGKKRVIDVGYSFKNTIYHISEDLSKLKFPGPAYYNEQSSFTKCTQNKPGPVYTVPLAGAMTMDNIRRYFI